MSAAVDTFRTWRMDAVAWGDTLCEAPGCFRPADLLADYDERRDEGVPVCCTDADVLLERWVAVDESRAVAGRLPDPWEAGRPPLRRRDSGPAEWEFADRSPEKWLAEQMGTNTSEPDWDIPF